jgi:peptidoglycan hydrolase-like protein with peptidoglycan-binding domain
VRADPDGTEQVIDMGKRILVLAVAVAVASAVAVGAVLWARHDADSGSDVSDAPATATAEVTDLTRTETFDGVVAYKDLRGLSSPLQGVITWLPVAGTDLGAGDTLMSINAQPVVLLTGAMPAWRDLHAGTSDGPDVQQLESSLLALGFGTKSASYPDGHWDVTTTEALVAFQQKVGAAADGELSLGEVVFSPTNVHVAKVDGVAGGTNDPAAPVVTVQSTDRIVIIEVDPLKRDLVTEGAAVNVELPGGEPAHGKITSVSTTLTQNADGKNVYQVTVTLDDPDQVKSLALAPVTVHYVATVAEQALAVPVSSIIGVPGGGYAVTVLKADGTSDRVSVALGTWGDGYVQVTGDLKAGDTVEVPS